MRRITYAGETVITTSDVAEALIKLTAAIANDGRAEAITIPIVVEQTGAVGDAELVIGVGNDVLSAPVAWGDEEPDFAQAAEELRSHPMYPRRAPSGGVLHLAPDPDANWDPDLEGFSRG